MFTETAEKTDRAGRVRLLGFSVENLGCVRLFNLEPSGSSRTIELHGSNGVGKSTVLDAFTWALVGDRALPEAPVRKGAEKGTVVVQTDKYTIRRTVTPKGTTSLKLTDANGASVARPQETLEAVWSDMAPDPMKFMDLAPGPQGRIIAKAIGLTDMLDAIAARHKAAYEARTLANRDRDQQAAVLAGFGPASPGPTEETSAQAIIDELAEAEEEVRSNAGFRKLLEGAQARRPALLEMVAKLKAALADAETKLAHCDAWLASEGPKIEALVDPDTAAIRSRLQTIEADNALARRRRERATAKARSEAAEKAALAADRLVEDIDEERRKALAAAKMPVPGMTIDEHGDVTVNGLPLSKLETSAKIKLGVKIVLATKPRLPIVLIQRGESLDATSMEVLRESLEEADGYALIEVVERSWDPTQGIVIVQGENGGAA